MSESALSLKKLARNRRFDELEVALLEAIDAGEVVRDDVVAILNLASHRGEPAELDSLFWLALSSWAEKHGPEEALCAAREAAPLLPGARAVREDLVAWLAAARADYPGSEALARKLLLTDRLPLPEVFRLADALFRLVPGTYGLARGGKAPLKVVGIHPSGETFVFESETGEQALELAAAAALAPLPADDYRALAVFEPETFAEYAAERPAALVEAVLRIHGPRLTYRDLRAHLVDRLPVPWSDWWNDARPRVRRSPWIDMTSSSQPTLELRRTPLSHDDEIREELAAASGLDRIGIVLDFLDESGEHAAAEGDLLHHFAQALDALARADDAPVALAAAAAIDEMRAVAPEALADIEPVPLPAGRAPADLMGPLAVPRIEDSVLDVIRARRPDDWAAFFAGAFAVLTPEGCDRAAADLRGAGREDDILPAVKEIMTNPRRFPGALVWLFKHAAGGGLPVDRGGPDRGELVCHMISTLDRASRAEGAKSPLASLLQSALSSGGWGLARRALAASDFAGARAVKELLERSSALTDNVRVKLQDLLAEAHPKVYAKDLPPWVQDDVIWTTPAGLAKKREEYSRLVNETLPRIAEAIGKAAAFGDLSENAEYSAALEERARMTERANSLKADLDKAKELAPEAADGDVVTVGSRVRARQTETGVERALSFLGPWDVDVAAGVYSYRAPLGLAFMGRRVGEVAATPSERGTEYWEIVGVESALS